MKKIAFYLLLIVAIQPHFLFSQTATDTEAKITSSLSDYFKLDREGIYLHLNKYVFISGDKIWLKGYIIQKQSRRPYFETANVYVSLLDNNGRKITSVLLYAENSVFEGHVDVPDSLAGGRYYLQAYTNYMNNFLEDESSVYTIDVIDPATTYLDYNSVNYDQADIAVFAESGTFLEGVSNTFGIHIADCNKNGIEVKDAQVKDGQGNVVATFSTDDNGYARFDIPNTKADIYKVVCNIKNKPFQKLLPMPKATGICFSVNNYVFADKATITVKTNDATLKEIKGRPYKLVIQKAQTASFIDIAFTATDTKQTLPIPAESFSDGINSVFLVDESLKEMGARIVYKPHLAILPTELFVAQKRGDSIVVSGKSGLSLASLSISVLPINDFRPMHDIFGLEVENNSLRGTKNYFDTFSRKKHYALDNLLLCQTPKYDWGDLVEKKMSSPKYAFDKGLTIKGTINSPISDRANSKVRISSFAYGLNEFSPINDKNEFIFERVLAQDSAQVFFSLINKKDKLDKLKIYTQIFDNNRTFNKPFVHTTCTPLNSVAEKFDFPKIKGLQILDTVVIAGHPQKKKLNKDNLTRFNNGMSRGYKITDDLATSFYTVLDFLQAYGYNVSTVGGTTRITRQYITSLNADNSPAIYVDDMFQYDFNQLLTYRMTMIDEIYINKRGYGEGMNGNTGVIRIYTKKVFQSTTHDPIVKSQSIIIKNGFQPLASYKNPEYLSYSDPGFRMFGTIHWEPNISTDQNGAFRFSFPNFNQQKVKVVIEGIDSNGNVMSEIQTLTLE